MHRYLVFEQLTFISLLSNPDLQHSSLHSTSSLVSSQITISSANSIVHCGSLLTSSVSLYIITANRNGLSAYPWCSPTLILKLSVVPAAHFTTVLLPSYPVQVVHTFLKFPIFSYSTIALLSEPCCKLSLGPQIHNLVLFHLPFTFPLTFLGQTWHR